MKGFITKENETYALTQERAGAIAEICPPIIEEDGKEFFAGAECGFDVSESQADCGDGLFMITRKITNISERERTFKLIFALRPCYKPEKYLIPCVSYNGNEWGEGLEPKGLVADNGEFWIHAYERTSIPSCTLTETSDISTSLFVSDNTKESLVSSCAIKPLEDGMVEQRIYWPITEAPYTYYENDKYTDRFDTYITLGGGESFECSVYILLAVPKYKNYGICETLDRALKIFPFKHGVNHTTEKLWDMGISYSRLLLTEYRGATLFSSGCRFKKDGSLWIIPHYEIGWCGQNIMNARMHLLEYFRTGEKALLDGALAVCDSWLQKQADNGLILSHYEWYTEGREWNYIPRDPTKTWAANVSYKTGWLPETCNTGWAGCEMLKVWKLLSDNGIDRPEYLDFATKILDFFCDVYSEEFGFGKAWHFDGRCEEERGTIGAFITMALCDGYRILGEQRYLDMAAKSLDFYMKRDLDDFICTAGAIDCTCVDKETAGPIIIAALDMYEFTKDEKYIEYALKASYYFASWMYVYDAYYDDTKEFTQYGYYTSGSTAVSVQHPALDQWGELMCCEWFRLADITGDERWRERAKIMWYNCTQCIADREDYNVHGFVRPIGSQNEAFYQARWGHRPDPNDKGHLNDWLVSWVNVFRLNVIDRMKTVCGYKDAKGLE